MSWLARFWPRPAGFQQPFPCSRYWQRRYGSKVHPRTFNLAARFSPSVIALGLAVTSATYYLTASPATVTALNNVTFVPYKVTSRESISPTSFILSISPHAPNNPASRTTSSAHHRRHALWSVEFKQPEVQIARHYTPLPPCSGDNAEDGSLSFYIRSVVDGEMSNYLNRLRQGHDAWLRGPHAGFDLVKRLGAEKDLVFLAGGTGVVPGMQAATLVLDSSQDTNVSLLWAIRSRDEMHSGAAPGVRSWWNFWHAPEPISLPRSVNGLSPIARRLNDMQAKYGDRLSIRVGIDEEQTQFQDRHLVSLLTRPSRGPVSHPMPAVKPCPLHDQATHEKTSEFQPPSLSCLCAPADGVIPGKKLFIVSGPDGFVTHFAGPKVWFGGQHTQGAIGGVAARLQRRHPRLAEDWLVLKL